MGTTPTAAATSDSSSSSSSKSRLHGTSSGGGVTKATAQSPAVQKWKSIVKTLTPELIRNSADQRITKFTTYIFFYAMCDNNEFIIPWINRYCKIMIFMRP